jgi:hypothetical protein
VHFTAVSLSLGVQRRMIGLLKKELDMKVGASGRGLRSRYEPGTTRIQSPSTSRGGTNSSSSSISSGGGGAVYRAVCLQPSV